MTTEKKKKTDNNERLLLTSGRIDLERLNDQDTTDEPIDDVICLFFSPFGQLGNCQGE